MKTIPYPDEANAIPIEHAEKRWTPEKDLRVLLWLTKQTAGTIIEIGCNEGRTTRDLALTFPKRKVIGVDCSAPDIGMLMEPEQRYEQPDAKRIGIEARCFPNVRTFNVPSYWFLQLYHEMKFGPAGLVFIDGNHSFNGVKRDTETVFNHIDVPVTVVWHDCYDNAPHWCGVKRYLERCPNAPDITHIEGTWIAFAHLPALAPDPGYPPL